MRPSARTTRAIVIFSRVETVNVRVPVEANDALEAAVASGCDCINNHCPALLTRYVPDPDAWIDPPRNTDTVGDEPDGN